MTKEKINETIFSLQTDEEIVDFVKKRFQELEDNSKETIDDQCYATSFREYISEKTHYKPVTGLKREKCPYLVYDDITPYINLVKSIKKGCWYNELSLFSTVFFEVHFYLPTTSINFFRGLTYMGNKGESISIKQFRENECAFCTEKSGMAHNMFKFLGVDSEIVFGHRNTVGHAYNIVFPLGYDNEPMVIFDPSYFVRFVKNEEVVIELGYFMALGREDYEKLMAGQPIKINLSRTERMYRQLYNFGDEYVFEGDLDGDSPSYMVGVDDYPI